MQDLFPRLNPHGFYVTIRRDNKTRLLLGPYPAHQEAIELIETGREMAIEYDQWCHFDEFGTCKITASKLPNGIFNSRRRSK